MNVLVTGGAGYIGSVVVEDCIAAGHTVTVIDNLSKGHREMVPDDAKLIVADTRDRHALDDALVGVDAVIHMAASSLVGESVVNPSLYYQNNLVAGLALLDAMVAGGVGRIVFSSTAAVYGEPENQPIDERAATQPTNPYGETKLAFEKCLSWYERAYGLRYASLRYFNAAGASERCGEMHDPETHLIPLVLDVAAGRSEFVTVFGDDYPTDDGTCIRDYIHVKDLSRAHLLALDGLEDGSGIFNLGCGGGHSVKQVIDAARRVTGREIPVKMAERRPGDPAILIASSASIETRLGWRPELGDLETIIESAWRWRGQHAS